MVEPLAAPAPGTTGALTPAPAAGPLKLSDETRHHALAGLFSIEPANMTELLSMAKMYAESELVPKDYQKKPANIVIAIQTGRSLGLSSLQSILSIAVINGRPTVWGDAIPALLYARGGLDTDFGNGGIKERMPDEALAQGEGLCEIKRKGWAEPIMRRFTIADAERAGLIKRSGPTGPWTTYPGRMLQMRARSWAARDACPDVLKGLRIAEEERDVMLDGHTGKPVHDIRPPKTIIDAEAVDKFTQEVARGSIGGMVPSQQRSSSRGSATAGTAAAGDLWKGQIEKITQKQGDTAGKSWTKYTIYGKDGTSFGTFERKDADAAKKYVGTGELVEVRYTTSQYGKDLVSIAAAAQPPTQEAPSNEAPREPGEEA